MRVVNSPIPDDPTDSQLPDDTGGLTWRRQVWRALREQMRMMQTSVSSEEMEEASATSLAAAADAKNLAANARQMVLNRDPRFDTIDERIAAIATVTDAQAASQTRLDVLASSYAAAVESSVLDRSNLHAAVAALQAEVTAGQSSDTTRIDELTARVNAEAVRLDAADATEKARALAAEAALKATADSDRQDAAAARAALAARLVALEVKMPAVTSGRASVALPLTLGGGATYSITVPFDSPAPDTAYLPLPIIDSSSTAVYSALDIVSVDQRTTTSCRVTVKNTTLLGVVGTLAVTVIALKV